MTCEPNSRRQLSIADARCSGHETVAAIGAKNVLRRQSSMSARRLRRRIASDGTTPWRSILARISVKYRLRNVDCSMSRSVSARTSSCCNGRSTPRTVRATRAREGRVRIILRMIAISSGASGPPRAHHTAPAMIAAARTMAAVRSQMLSGAAGADAQPLSATVSISRDAPPAVASASRKSSASRSSATASCRARTVATSAGALSHRASSSSPRCVRARESNWKSEACPKISRSREYR